MFVVGGHGIVVVVGRTSLVINIVAFEDRIIFGVWIEYHVLGVIIAVAVGFALRPVEQYFELRAERIGLYTVVERKCIEIVRVVRIVYRRYVLFHSTFVHVHVAQAFGVTAEPEYVGFETYRLAVRYVVYGTYVDTFVVVIAFAERFRVAAVALFLEY